MSESTCGRSGAFTNSVKFELPFSVLKHGGSGSLFQDFLYGFPVYKTYLIYSVWFFHLFQVVNMKLKAKNALPTHH